MESTTLFTFTLSCIDPSLQCRPIPTALNMWYVKLIWQMKWAKSQCIVATVSNMCIYIHPCSVADCCAPDRTNIIIIIIISVERFKSHICLWQTFGNLFAHKYIIIINLGSNAENKSFGNFIVISNIVRLRRIFVEGAHRPNRTHHCIAPLRHCIAIGFIYFFERWASRSSRRRHHHHYNRRLHHRSPSSNEWVGLTATHCSKSN